MFITLIASLWMSALASSNAMVPANVRPSIVPWNIHTQYADASSERGRPIQKLACEPLWDGQAHLCFRLIHGKKREWVTVEHLRNWNVSYDGLKSSVFDQGREHIKQQLKPVEVEGVNKRYWVATNDSGWASAVLFSPDVFYGTMQSSSVLAAVPAHGIVLMWPAGDPELDKIVAVGVREIYSTRAGAVSPVIYRWTGAAWVPFVEAVVRPEEK